MSAEGAKVILSQVKADPSTVLGLATGSTPVGMYTELIGAYKNGECDFSQVRTFNLDEYYPIGRTHEQSYYRFMREKLFDGINVPAENINIPNGEASDAELECSQYDERIAEAGGIDVMVLGVGMNGHIGFNEPAQELEAATHITELDDSTREANSRFFDKLEDVPTQALTMGMRSILSAKKILLLISGESKRPLLEKLLSGKISTDCPVTLLNTVRDLVVVTDIKL